MTVVAVVVVPVRVARVEVEVVRVVQVARVECGRPVVAVRPRVVQLAISAVACGGQENVNFLRRQSADTDGS